MCERYVIPEQAEVEREFRPTQRWWKFSPSFNISTERNVPVIRMHRGESEGVMLRWGMIPDWAEADPTKATASHAHLGEIERSKFFRGAWSRGQRCIVPLAGFYAWQLTEARYRQPFYIRVADQPVFGIAALWDHTESDDNEDVIESCAQLTVPPNALLATIQNTKAHMPAILRREDYDTWLTAPPAIAKSVIRTFPHEQMIVRAISPRINSLKYDDPHLIRPAEEAIRHCA